MQRTFRIHGLEEFRRKLDDLDKRTRTKVLRKAVRAGAAPQRREMKARAPVRTGSLRRSIIVKVKQYGGNVRAIVGPNSKFVGKGGEKPYLYAHLVEFGDAIRPASGFARSAFDGTTAEVLRLVKAKLATEIAAEVAAIAGKAAPF